MPRNGRFERNPTAVEVVAIGMLAQTWPSGKPSAAAGIATGRSRRRELHVNLGKFWRSVSEEPALRRLTAGPELAALGAALFGEPARSHDYLFLRCASRGKATGIHCDAPFFTRM